MRVLATLRVPFVLLLLLAVTIPGGDSSAQVNPTWDHYKVYDLNPKPPGPPAVILRDQFMQTTHQVMFLDRFMNPVEKTHLSTGLTYPVHKPFLHYTWWRISDVPFDATVVYDNQFGGGSVHIGPAQYLLNPALKNEVTPQLPLENHYRCYACQAPQMTIPLRLIDQFDTWQMDQLIPRYFCTPVEKQVPGQAPNPIVDPEQNYICYEFLPPDPQLFPALIRDQFIQISAELQPGRWLCVPTDKMQVTKAGNSTWGRLKQIYR
jgi:hypothetical protein